MSRAKKWSKVVELSAEVSGDNTGLGIKHFGEGVELETVRISPKCSRIDEISNFEDKR
jgi:hypothetical protein